MDLSMVTTGSPILDTLIGGVLASIVWYVILNVIGIGRVWSGFRRILTSVMLAMVTIAAPYFAYWAINQML